MKKIKNTSKYPDNKNKKNIILNFVKDINKKFTFNKDIFDTMCICFAAEKSIKQKRELKSNIYKNFMFKKKTFIVAEIGNNHEGSYKVAKELVLQAANAGVDAVKFQTFKVSEFLSKK